MKNDGEMFKKTPAMQRENQSQEFGGVKKTENESSRNSRIPLDTQIECVHGNIHSVKKCPSCQERENQSQKTANRIIKDSPIENSGLSFSSSDTQSPRKTPILYGNRRETNQNVEGVSDLCEDCGRLKEKHFSYDLCYQRDVGKNRFYCCSVFTPKTEEKK